MYDRTAEREIADLRRKVAELEKLVPKWASGEELRRLESIGWRGQRAAMVGGEMLQFMVPPIPIPEDAG